MIKNPYNQTTEPASYKWFEEVKRPRLERSESKLIKKPMKTSSITLDSIKCTDGWYQVGNELGFSDEKINKVFEYGEFGNIEIIIDENLNIIGGKVIPFKS